MGGFKAPITGGFTSGPFDRSRGPVRTPPPTTLTVLPELGTTDLHLVADDYTSGNWASRVGGFTATLSGTVTKQATSRFSGRYELTGFSANNAFSLAADAAHTYNTTALTYEIIVKLSLAGSAYCAVGFTAATQGHMIRPNNVVTATNVCTVTNSAGGTYQGVSSSTLSTQTTKYSMITVVLDPVTPIARYGINGNATSQTSATVTGSLNTTPHGLGIGALWNGATFSSPWSSTIVEIIRHREALSTSTITSRAAQFNALKGY